MGKLYFALTNSALNALNTGSILGEHTVSVYKRLLTSSPINLWTKLLTKASSECASCLFASGL